MKVSGMWFAMTSDSNATAQQERSRPQCSAQAPVDVQTVLEKIGQGVCYFGGDQRLILSNRRYAEIYGLAPAEIRLAIVTKDFRHCTLARRFNHVVQVDELPAQFPGQDGAHSGFAGAHETYEKHCSWPACRVSGQRTGFASDGFRLPETVLHPPSPMVQRFLFSAS